MKFLILLAVLWAAGSLLFAAESSFTARTKPAAQTQRTTVPETGSAAAMSLRAADEDAVKAAEAVAEDSAEDDSKEASSKEEEPKEEEPKAASREPARSEDDKDETASEKAASAEPKSAADAGSPRRFVPSEQVRADFDVSFPIDI